MMKRIFFLTMIVFVMGGLVSCTKEEDEPMTVDCQEDCLVVTGVLTTGDGTEVMTNYPVKAIWTYSDMYTAINRTKAQTNTDGSGRYTMKMKLNEEELTSGTLRIEILLDIVKYFNCYDEPIEYYTLHYPRNDVTYIRDFHFPYTAFLDVKATGAETMNISDQFILELHLNECRFYGGWTTDYADRIYHIKVPADQKLYIKVDCHNNGLWTHHLDSLRVSRGQTESYTAVFK